MNQQRVLTSMIAMMVILSSQVSFARSTTLEKARLNTNELNRLVSEAATEHYVIATDRNENRHNLNEVDSEAKAVTVEIGEE